MQQTKKFKMADAISPYLAVSCGLSQCEMPHANSLSMSMKCVFGNTSKNANFLMMASATLFLNGANTKTSHQVLSPFYNCKIYGHNASYIRATIVIIVMSLIVLPVSPYAIAPAQAISIRDGLPSTPCSSRIYLHLSFYYKPILRISRNRGKHNLVNYRIYPPCIIYALLFVINNRFGHRNIKTPYKVC